MFPSEEAPRLTVRFPPDVRQWLDEQAIRYGSSSTSEVVRAVRERMDRTKQVDQKDAG